MSDAANRFTRINTQARVYFMDLGRRGPAENEKGFGVDIFDTEDGKRIYGIDVQDLMSFNVSRNVTNSGPGTFRITLSNRNDRYFFKDNPEADIEAAAQRDPDMPNDDPKWQAYPYSPVVGSFTRGFLEYPHYQGIQADPANSSLLVWAKRELGTGKFWYYSYDKVGTKIKADFSSAAQEKMKRETREAWDFYRKYEGNIRKANCLFAPMQYVSIWMPRRFPDAQGDTMVVFTGIVNTVSESWRDGQSTIDITGEDVTKWLRLNRVNMDPAAVPLTGDPKASTGFQEYKNKFSGKEGWQIIEKLVADVFNFDEMNTGDAAGQTDPDLYYYQPTMLLTAFVPTINEQVAKVFSSARVHVQVMPTDAEVDELLKGTGSGSTANEPVLRFSPYKAMFRTQPPIFESTYKDRLSICWDVAKLTDFVFYADAAGDLWYHQPRYDIAHILCAPNPEVYVIRDEAVVDWNFSETDDNMVTRVRVFGLGAFLPEGVGETSIAKGMFNMVEEKSLARYYGTREQSIEHPYVWGAEQCAYYGKSFMRRSNADLHQGTVTITGRAEIQPGFPVYIPGRNKIYYIKSVDHTYTFGGQFTTSLGLSMGRKPWDILSEMLDYSGPPDTPLTKARRDEGVDKYNKLQDRTARRKATIWLRTGGGGDNALIMWPPAGIALQVAKSDDERWSATEKEKWRLGPSSVVPVASLRGALIDYAWKFKELADTDETNPPLLKGERIKYALGHPEGWYTYATQREAYDDTKNHTGAIRLLSGGLDCSTFLTVLFAGIGILKQSNGEWMNGGAPVWMDTLADGNPGLNGWKTFSDFYAAKKASTASSAMVTDFYDRYMKAGDVLVFGGGAHLGLYYGEGLFFHCSVLKDSEDSSQPHGQQNMSAIHLSYVEDYKHKLTDARRYLGGWTYTDSERDGQECEVASDAAAVRKVEYIVPTPWKFLLK